MSYNYISPLPLALIYPPALSNALSHFLPQLPENTIARRLHKVMIKQRRSTLLHCEFHVHSMRVVLHSVL